MTDRIISLFIVLCFLVSCEKDEGIRSPEDQVAWKATVTKGDVLDAEPHYHTIGIKTEGLEVGQFILLSTDAEWFKLQSDTLPADGLFDVLPEENTDTEERTAELTLTNSADGSTCMVEIVQTGRVGYNDDISSAYRIGNGFSCFDEFKCTTSLRGKIIDEAKLREFDGGNTFITIQDAVRGEMRYEFYSAYSMAEMQSKLTKTTTTSTSFLGFKKTVKRFSQVSKSSTNEQYYGYARMIRVVGSSAMDVGALKYIVFNQENIKVGKLPFTGGFYTYYNKINKASASERAKLIEQMLDKYGTHVIVQTSLGGSLDLVATYKRSLTTSLEETTKSVYKNVTGTQSSSSSMSSVSSSLSSSSAIQICGGSRETAQALRDNAKTLSSEGRGTLSRELLDAWLGTITYASLYDEEKRKNLDAVDFSFIPVWELFADKTVSREILAVVTAMADREKNTFSDQVLGVDNYALPLTNEMMSFGDKPTSSLVRIASIDNVPMAEICNEYVPTVRSDKRITVVYPIVNGITRITLGLFPGDGENRPAYLSFSGADVYVNPLEGYGSTDKLNTIYYLHGALYPEDQGIPLRKGEIVIKDHVMDFNGGNKYPVVKIGSGYWLRCNIKDDMQFGEPIDSNDPEGDYYIHNDIINGTLYANIFFGNSYGFRDSFPGLFDDKTDSDGNRIHWYVPSVSDLRNLQQFIGGHCKALLLSQQSGFDAQFAGYYGCYDDLNDGKEYSDGIYTLRYEGQQCFIAAKDDSSSGCVLVIYPDYTLQLCNTERKRDNWYPVRPYRSSHYKYY